jgi:hypothetical protein
MVNWTEISYAISNNTEKGFSVRLLSVPICEGSVEKFPILSRPMNVQNEHKKCSALNDSLASLAHDTIENGSKPKSPVQISPKSVKEIQTTVSVPASAATTIYLPVEEVEVQPTPPVPAPVPAAPVPAAPVTAAPAPVPATADHAQPRLSEPRTSRTIIDPLVLGIEENDPLYKDAPKHSKHQMETEAALYLEKILPDLYKSQGGRARGWTKSGLETMIKPRCASGGNTKELDRVKAAFIWQLATSDKATSAFLDFLCVAKQIRVAIWYTEEKRIVLYPAADYVGIEPNSKYPLYHVTCKGELRHGLNSYKDLIQFCDRDGWILLPPLSIQHTLSGLTLAELESVGKKLGMATVEGSKTERVAAVAVYKLRQRLLCA